MDHTWKKVAPEKVGHTWKNGSHLKKRSHFYKWVTLVEVGHTCTRRSNFEKWVTLAKAVHNMKKSVKLARVGHTWKNGHLQKWVTLEKLAYT